MAWAGYILPLLLASASAVHYRDCGSKGAKISQVTVTPCGEGARCVLLEGRNATVSVDFVSQVDTVSAKAVVHGKVSVLPFVPFPLQDSDACTAGHLVCPVKKGSKQHYQQNLFVKTEYPSVNVMVKWEVQDDAGSDIICLMIPVTLQKASVRVSQIGSVSALTPHRPDLGLLDALRFSLRSEWPFVYFPVQLV